MTQWFVQRANEEVVGPLTPNELLTLVRSGQVTAETKVRNCTSEWLRAGDVGGLFEAAMRPTIENYCPWCENRLDSTPCQCAGCGREVTQPKTRIIENTIAQPPDPNES